MTALLASAASGYSLDRVVAVEDIDLAADDHVDVERDVERLRLRRAIGALPDRERTVMERYTYGGESFEEIAEGTGMARSTVFNLYTRTVQSLRKAFDPTLPQAL